LLKYLKNVGVLRKILRQDLYAILM